MKIGVLSDLYIDQLGALPVPRDQPDVLVLAGDIGRGATGLHWAVRTYTCPIVYVLGNYSYHEHNFDTLDEELRSMGWGTNVHFLQNQTLIVRGVRFIGSTLWTDFNLHGDPETAMLWAQEGSDDYRAILNGAGLPISPLDTLERHRRAVGYLRNAATERYDDGHTVVITHHAPSMQSVPPAYRDDPMAAAYASNLDDLVTAADAMLWVHASEYGPVDYTLGDIRVVANPRGHRRERRENDRFRPDYVVDF